MKPDTNTLYYGDCLDWMSRWDDETIDLIYLDPPFNSNAHYNVLFDRESLGGEYRAFIDTWTWDEEASKRLNNYKNSVGKPAYRTIDGFYTILGESGMLSYLTYMAERLEHMHRLLKPTGSIYLHCDPTASHYLKVIMDCIFNNKKSYFNEIIWTYRLGGSSPKAWSKKHDVILFYKKSIDAYFDKPLMPSTSQRMAGKPKGMIDVWTDIPSLNNQSKERTGYPTQKPIALLDRIIEASTPKDGIVLDPFCGCGTTIKSAIKMGRKWAGIDISSFAIDLIMKERLKDERIVAKGIPRDLRSAKKLAKEHPFDFESWAITRLPGFTPNKKKVADRGVDGRAKLASKPDDFDSTLALAQVKGGEGYTMSQLRDFIGVNHREAAALGRYITLISKITPSAKRECLGQGEIIVQGISYPRMKMWSIEEYFDNIDADLPIMNDPYTGKSLDQHTMFE